MYVCMRTWFDLHVSSADVEASKSAYTKSSPTVWVFLLVKLKKKCHSGQKSQKVTRYVERVVALDHCRLRTSERTKYVSTLVCMHSSKNKDMKPKHTYMHTYIQEAEVQQVKDEKRAAWSQNTHAFIHTYRRRKCSKWKATSHVYIHTHIRTYI